MYYLESKNFSKVLEQVYATWLEAWQYKGSFNKQLALFEIFVYIFGVEEQRELLTSCARQMGAWLYKNYAMLSRISEQLHGTSLRRTFTKNIFIIEIVVSGSLHTTHYTVNTKISPAIHSNTKLKLKASWITAYNSQEMNQDVKNSGD